MTLPMEPRTEPRSRLVPILQGILPVSRAQAWLDMLAGITLAALAIPEVMGYTKIAGTPVITGLYTILIPMAIFAIFGSSRHLVVGADSATAATLAAGLAAMVTFGSAAYVALAGLLAIVTGGLLLLTRIIRLGFLADFLSRTVLAGFLAGVGIYVAVGQVSGMLGLPGGGGHGTLEEFIRDAGQFNQMSLISPAVSVTMLAVIVGARRLTKRIPGALIAVAGITLLSWEFDLSSQGLPVLGPIPGGLPQLGLPHVSWSDVPPLLATAFSCCLIILTQSAATSRSYADRYDEPFSEDTDLVGLSLANLAAGLSSTFVVNGSPTKTEMVDAAGGRSQISQVTASVVVLAVLLFLTGPLAYMPSAALSAVVFLIGLELVHIKELRTILAERPPEFVVALITAGAVVLVGVEQAIVLAMVLSLLEHLRRGYKPKNALIASDGSHGWRSFPLSTGAEALPGLLIYRFNHGLYYANAGQFATEVLNLVRAAQPPAAWLCVDAAAIADVDFTAGETLKQMYAQLKQRGIRLVLAEADDTVQAELDRYGFTGLVGRDAYHETITNLMGAYRRAVEAGDVQPLPGAERIVV